MRPITLISALAATLNLLAGTALAGVWTWPVRGPVITAYRNGDDPYAAGQHRGIDVGAPVGSRVVAAAGGTVTFVGIAGSSGLTVSERTADGRFDLSYLHLSAASVHRGEAVAEGAALGAVGVSGRRSAEAPHLHFGVREAGSRSAYRDPLDFLAPPPAADAPDPAPAPVPVTQPAEPEPVAAGPAPAPAVPAAASAPAIPAAALAPPSPVSSAVPLPSPAVPHLAPAAAPSRFLHPSRGHVELPRGPMAPAGAKAAHGTARTEPHPDPRPEPLTGPDSVPAAAPTHGSGPSPAADRARGSHRTDKGIDLGWLAACVGLIAVATALGHPGGTRKTVARGRASLGALLRPASREGSAR
jgi:hypothetical protein